MKKKVALLLAGSLLMSLLGALSACKDSGDGPGATPTPNNSVTISTVNAYAIVWGYEWGPAVPKVVLEFDGDVTGFANDTFGVKFGAASREVKAVYNSDENGSKSDSATKYLTIEMTPKYNEASPFAYVGSVNIWADSIDFKVTVNDGKSFQVGGTTYQGGDNCSCSVTAAGRKVPQTAGWVKDTVHYQDDVKDITLSRASWAPAGADSDSGKNPLIIWLHGAGEGGTDIDIDLLGNEVTALTTENETNVQKYFAADGLAGAYVLAVQTPTMWMDDGTGNYNLNDESATGKQESWYTEALWLAITSYVEGNPDIDTDRIYLGGCSNGGYMTMNMMFEHGGYFAAYYPICEAYSDARISDEMIEAVKDYNIWFLLSADDTTVDPSVCALPTYVRLLNAGAENAWLTLTENVKGTDDPNPSSWFGPSGFYMGHWSWIYAFNDQVTTRFDPAKVTSEDYLTPGNCDVTGVNLWAWMAEQRLPGDAG